MSGPERLTLTAGPVTRALGGRLEEVDLLAAPRDNSGTGYMESNARKQFALCAWEVGVVWPTVLLTWSKRLLTISAQRTA